MNISSFYTQNFNQTPNRQLREGQVSKPFSVISDTFKRIPTVNTSIVNPPAFTGSKDVPIPEMSHEKFVFLHSRIFIKYQPQAGSVWHAYFSNKQEASDDLGWKIHVYADSEKDWQNVARVVLPYLIKKDVTHKTFGLKEPPKGCYVGDKQAGKTITVYPSSIKEMKELLSGIELIIKNNNLERKDTSIQGDRPIGSRGRLFYRYEFESKENKTYAPNRTGQTDAYLAEDMSIEDDPFYNFNPESLWKSRNNSESTEPASEMEDWKRSVDDEEAYTSEQIARAGAKCITDKSVLKLPGLDLLLKHDYFRKIFDGLDEGQKIMIGRDKSCDIVIPESFTNVYDRHLVLRKHNGEIYARNILCDRAGVE